MTRGEGHELPFAIRAHSMIAHAARAMMLPAIPGAIKSSMGSFNKPAEPQGRHGAAAHLGLARCACCQLPRPHLAPPHAGSLQQPWVLWLHLVTLFWYDGPPLFKPPPGSMIHPPTRYCGSWRTSNTGGKLPGGCPQHMGSGGQRHHDTATARPRQRPCAVVTGASHSTQGRYAATLRDSSTSVWTMQADPAAVGQ